MYRLYGTPLLSYAGSGLSSARNGMKSAIVIFCRTCRRSLFNAANAASPSKFRPLVFLPHSFPSPASLCLHSLVNPCGSFLERLWQSRPERQGERMTEIITQSITQSEIDQLTESELRSIYSQVFIARSSRQLAEPEYQQMTIVLYAIKKALYRFKIRACFKM